MFKKIKQNNEDKRIRMLLGNLREIELGVSFGAYEDLDDLKERLNNLGNIIEDLYNNQIKSRKFMKLSEDNKTLVLKQIDSMEHTMIKQKKFYFDTKLLIARMNTK